MAVPALKAMAGIQRHWGVPSGHHSGVAWAFKVIKLDVKVLFYVLESH